MAGTKKRNPKARSEISRERIKTSMIIGRLQKHIKGEIELSNTQLAAAKMLLDRVLPVLQFEKKTVEETRTIEGEVVHRTETPINGFLQQFSGDKDQEETQH